MILSFFSSLAGLGPHAITLNQQIKEADQWSVRRAREVCRSPWRAPVAEFTQLLERYQNDQTPLPSLPDYVIQERIAAGWPADDPLLTVAVSPLARQAGFTQFNLNWFDEMRKPLEAAVAAVGIQPWFTRDAVLIEHADGHGQIPWSLPLHRPQAVALVGIVRTAAATVIAAVSGMRASELMELQIGCRRPPEVFGPGMVRYRLASKLIKGQPLGGTRDEWVVIEPAYQAVEVVEQLHDDPADGALLFGRLAFGIRYQWFRNWVNGSSGQRLGLAPIPDSPVNLRALRRTLAIELAYRPGGVLASKIHLKHVATIILSS
jgi:integrase